MRRVCASEAQLVARTANVVAALAQRRQLECRRGDGGRSRGGTDPRRPPAQCGCAGDEARGKTPSGGSPPRRCHDPFLGDAQQLGLHFSSGMSPTSSSQEGAVLRQLELARCPCVEAPVKAPASYPNSSAFPRSSRGSPERSRPRRVGPPRGRVVDRLRPGSSLPCPSRR